MTSTPMELGAGQIISLIEAGAYPREVVITVARGFLPLPQEDLVAVLAYLAGQQDEEVASLAKTSLAEIPFRVILAFAQNESAPPEQLLNLVNAALDNQVLEALIRNRAVSDAAVAELASRAEAGLQEVIVINQARILRSPEILDALLANPRLSADVRRRALETREEFFDKKARIQAALPVELVEPDLLTMSNEAIADLLEKAELEEAGGTASASATSAPSIPLDGEEGEEKKVAIWARIQNMTISEKVQLAFKGDKMVRMLLVRERNKVVCSAAMRNPRMSETEVENIAGMRNVEEEVLRIIGTRREWLAKYPIVLALCRNPKVPLALVLPLINRLTLRDLKGLKDDKNVAEVVRTMARKFYQARSQKS